MISEATNLERFVLNDFEISDYLSAQSIEIRCQTSSKKRLLEKMAGLLLKGHPDLDRKTVCQILTERERLGSTGIGHGVAIPHGRVNGLDQPIGALAILGTPVDFDAIDQQPVVLSFGLLVPAEANEEHLRILAFLARILNQQELREKLIAAGSAEEAHQLLVSWRQ